MGEITGRKVLIFTVAAFGVVVAVNLTMAVLAVRTFPGLEVANSYVASQTFDDRRAAQEALGWSLDAAYQGGTLTITVTAKDGGRPAVADLQALVGWATSTEDDVTPDFTQAGGTFTAPVELEPGNWDIRVKARAADGTEFRQRLALHVGRPGG